LASSYLAAAAASSSSSSSFEFLMVCLSVRQGNNRIYCSRNKGHFLQEEEEEMGGGTHQEESNKQVSRADKLWSWCTA
jgi:hypothetical protein